MGRWVVSRLRAPADASSPSEFSRAPAVAVAPPTLHPFLLIIFLADFIPTEALVVRLGALIVGIDGPRPDVRELGARLLGPQKGDNDASVEEHQHPARLLAVWFLSKLAEQLDGLDVGRASRHYPAVRSAGRVRGAHARRRGYEAGDRDGLFVLHKLQGVRRDMALVVLVEAPHLGLFGNCATELVWLLVRSALRGLLRIATARGGLGGCVWGDGHTADLHQTRRDVSHTKEKPHYLVLRRDSVRTVYEKEVP